MKSSFSRSFSTAAAILLIALTLLGTSFQLQVNNFLKESTVSGLQQDADVIADLAAAYSINDYLLGFVVSVSLHEHINTCIYTRYYLIFI